MGNFLAKYQFYIVMGLLTLFFVAGAASMAGDSGIDDEIAHIPAGYSYLRYGDYRLNPEHPPLLKDMAAFPLLFMHLNFPTAIPAWTTDVNGQWDAGWSFIYYMGNNADQMIFAARMPILLLAVAFGLSLFFFMKKRFGLIAGLLTLVFYTFSPNILAHARFVTTDLGITAFIFWAIWAYINALKEPTRRNLIIATVALAGAELAKFSAVLLIPFFVVLAAIMILVKTDLPLKARVAKYFGSLFLIFAGTFILIWVFYALHTYHMPVAVQDRLIVGSLPKSAFVPILTKLNKFPLMKPLVQYLLGVLMVVTRVAGGNTTYFLGQVSNQSFVAYFPFTFSVKTQISLLLISAAGLGYGAYEYLSAAPLKVWTKFKAYAGGHLVELTSLLFIALYSYVSITGNLNLGIRHLLPIMPFVFLLAAEKGLKLFEKVRPRLPRALPIISGVLIAWYMLAQILIYPSFLAYFNEFTGGPGNAYKYLTDSSVDWGQDLKRLVTYVKSHPEIDKIAVDYFGGGEPHYYFCQRTYLDGKLVTDSKGFDCSHSPFVEWHVQYGRPPYRYIAVSETYLMNDIYWAHLRGDQGYAYLRAMKPIAKIGYSIYVYKL